MARICGGVVGLEALPAADAAGDHPTGVLEAGNVASYLQWLWIWPSWSLASLQSLGRGVVRNGSRNRRTVQVQRLSRVYRGQTPPPPSQMGLMAGSLATGVTAVNPPTPMGIKPQLQPLLWLLAYLQLLAPAFLGWLRSHCSAKRQPYTK